jgi:hypothetical protein
MIKRVLLWCAVAFSLPVWAYAQTKADSTRVPAKLRNRETVTNTEASRTEKKQTGPSVDAATGTNAIDSTRSSLGGDLTTGDIMLTIPLLSGSPPRLEQISDITRDLRVLGEAPLPNELKNMTSEEVLRAYEKLYNRLLDSVGERLGIGARVLNQPTPQGALYDKDGHAWLYKLPGIGALNTNLCPLNVIMWTTDLRWRPSDRDIYGWRPEKEINTGQNAIHRNSLAGDDTESPSKK